VGGKTKTNYVPVGMLKEVQAWVEELRWIKELMKEVSGLNEQILRACVPTCQQAGPSPEIETLRTERIRSTPGRAPALLPRIPHRNHQKSRKAPHGSRLNDLLRFGDVIAKAVGEPGAIFSQAFGTIRNHAKRLMEALRYGLPDMNGPPGMDRFQIRLARC